MLQFDYVLETLAPLCFAEQSGDNVLYATKQYIPGASLRGALAAAYIRKYSLVEAHKDPLFRKLFLTGEVRYLPAYPQSEVGVTAMPVPLSVMISKDGNTIVDFSNGIDAKVGFKKLSGFVAIDETKKLLITVSPNVQIEFHMSRAGEKERISGSSIDGKVFNYEYLEPYQKFAGRVLVNDGCDDAIAELKQLLQGKLGLGRSRSSQYGTCSCKLQGEHNVELNDKIPQELYLLAYSAYIPGEGWQRTDDLAKELVEELNTALEAGGSNVRLSTEHTQIFAATENIDSFVGVWGLKRERKTALAAGSLIGIKAAGLDAEAFKIIQQRLLEGFGERTAEGFGSFVLWAPLEDGYSKQEQAASKQSNVNLNAVKEDALAILRTKILEEIRNCAKNDSVSMTMSEKGKGTLKRVEALTDSDKTKAEIQEKIDNFRKTAKANLFGMRLKGQPLLHCILEQENVAQPYAGIDWFAKLGLSKELAKALKADLGISVNLVSEDDLFKEYWLWFARHGVKGIKKQDSRKQKMFTIGDSVESRE